MSPGHCFFKSPRKDTMPRDCKIFLLEPNLTAAKGFHPLCDSNFKSYHLPPIIMSRQKNPLTANRSFGTKPDSSKRVSPSLRFQLQERKPFDYKIILVKPSLTAAKGFHPLCDSNFKRKTF